MTGTWTGGEQGSAQRWSDQPQGLDFEAMAAQRLQDREARLQRETALRRRRRLLVLLTLATLASGVTAAGWWQRAWLAEQWTAWSSEDPASGAEPTPAATDAPAAQRRDVRSRARSAEPRSPEEDAAILAALERWGPVQDRLERKRAERAGYQARLDAHDARLAQLGKAHETARIDKARAEEAGNRSTAWDLGVRMQDLVHAAKAEQLKRAHVQDLADRADRQLATIEAELAELNAVLEHER